MTDTKAKEPIFDLYSHLKCNIKSTLNTCEIHDSDFTTYCFQCKRSICDVCVEAFHSNHFHINKKEINMNKETVDRTYEKLENGIKELICFSQPDQIKNNLKNSLNKEVNLLYEKIEKYKALKLKEIEDTFKHNSNDASCLLTLVREAKNKINDFNNKHRDFLSGKNVTDEDNFIFLLNYDLMNEGISSGTDYLESLKEIEQYYNGSSCMEKSSLNTIIREMDDILKEELIKVELNNKIVNDFIEDGLPEPDRKQKQPLQPRKHSSNKNSAASDVRSPVRRCTIQINRLESIYMERKNARKKFLDSMDKLKDNKFEEIANKTNLLNEFLETFKDSVYQNFKKQGSMVEIEKLVKMYEEKSNKRMTYNGKSGLKFSNSTAKSVKSGLTRSKATFATMKKGDDSGSEGEIKEESVEKAKPLQKQKKKKENKGNSEGKDKTTKQNAIKTQLFSLDENEEGENDSNYGDFSDDEDSDHLNMLTNNDEIDVAIENNIKMNDPKILKRERMFKPRPRLYRRKLFAASVDKKEKKDNLNNNQSNDLFKVNTKLLELIKENQRLTSMIKSQEDITLQISTVRRYFAFMLMEFVRKNFKVSNKMDSHLFLNESKKEEAQTNDYIRIQEGGTQLYIYNRDTRKKKILNLKFSKKDHGVTYFPVGCRYYYYTDRVYITGGKVNNTPIGVVLCYIIKENRLLKMSNMLHPRAYHSVIFHENLKSLIVFGGEEESSCEMYDFFLNMWTTIPSLNVPRSNISIHIDRLGTYAYALFGLTGPIVDAKCSDVVEFLDLIDMNQGWAKVDYKNKAEVDLKLGEINFVPLNEEKLIIYGGNESRKFHRCFCIFDLKKFELTKLDKDQLEYYMAKIALQPEGN